MKRYLTAVFFCALSLTSQLAHADIIDDAIGNIQQAINDAYNPGSNITIVVGSLMTAAASLTIASVS